MDKQVVLNRLRENQVQQKAGLAWVRVLSYLMLLCSLGTLLCAPALGQAVSVAKLAAAGAKVASTEPPEAKTKFVAVPMADIGVRSQQAEQRIRESLRIIQPKVGEGAVLEKIAALRVRVNQQLRRSAVVKASRTSIMALDQVHAAWDQIAYRISQVQGGLQGRSNIIESQADRIRTIKSTWMNTRESALKLEVSSVVVAQINEVLTAANQALVEVAKRQANVLSRQSEVASLAVLVDGDKQLIVDRLNQTVKEVLVRNAPPIWDASFWKSSSQVHLTTNVHDQGNRDLAIMSRYWGANRNQVISFGAFVLFLILVMSFARKKIDTKLGNDADMDAVHAVFKRPIALSLLIAFFSSLWFFRDLAVGPLGPLFGAATLIPAMLVLWHIVDRPILPLVVLGVCVYFAHQVQVLLGQAALYSVGKVPALVTTDVAGRLIFLGNMTALVGFIGLSLSPSRIKAIPAEMASRLTFRMIGYVLRLVFVAALISWLAEAVGYAALASLVGGTLMMGIYGSIVLYGTVLVADGLVVLALRVRPLNALGMVRRNRGFLRDRVYLLMTLAAWLVMAQALVSQLHLWDELKLIVRSVLDAKLPIPGVELSLGTVCLAVLVVVSSYMLSRLIHFVLSEEIFDTTEIDRGRPYALVTLLHYGLLIVGFFLAGVTLGFDANRMTLLTGAFGIGIGFGLQTIVNNFISGVILLTERPVQVGDSVVMGEVVGAIDRIGIRSSTVRTWEGAEVIVPNARFISEDVTNWTKSDRKRRFEVAVGVAYGTDPEAVIEILEQAVIKIEGVLESPAPSALFKAFGDNSLDFEVRGWANQDHFSRLRSNICVSINRSLTEAGVEIPFPQRDIHIREGANALEE
ncbi:MAG: hypothetical protein CL917_08005 [Deltaproteobacteria bacterium]|nr:hypothetical protein [Deltaproteobacteria bacterium]